MNMRIIMVIAWVVCAAAMVLEIMNHNYRAAIWIGVSALWIGNTWMWYNKANLKNLRG